MITRCIIERYNLTETKKTMEEKTGLPMSRIMELYDVYFDEYGYIHDTGFVTILSERLLRNGKKYGENWDTFTRDFNAHLKEHERRVKYCIEYGYH